MKNKAHVAGISFAIVFGFSFMFSKIALENVSPLGLIAYRFLVAIVVFEVLRLTKLVKIRFSKELFIPILLVAIFQPVLYFLFETFGLDLIPSSEAGLMIALIPIFVVILSSLILKEKPGLLQIVFILISVSGILIIQLFKTDITSDFSLEDSILGFTLLLLAVISAALFNIASRSASKKVKPYELTYFMMLYGAVSFNIIYIFELIYHHDLSNYFTYFVQIDVFFPILYLGVIASIGGFFLVNYALSQLPAHVSSIYANLSTVIAVIAGYLFLEEGIYWYHIVGGVMIIIGVYGTARANYVYQKRMKQYDQNH